MFSFFSRLCRYVTKSTTFCCYQSPGSLLSLLFLSVSSTSPEAATSLTVYKPSFIFYTLTVFPSELWPYSTTLLLIPVWWGLSPPQVSNGDLAEAVAFLTEKNAKVPQQDETTYYQTSQVASDRYISVGSQADTSELQTLFLKIISTLPNAERLTRLVPVQMSST